MKRIALLIPTLAAVMMINAMPAYSDEYNTQFEPKTGVQEQSADQKDECLLVARNCPDEVDSVQQRIDKLQIEINKGTDVYTPDELNILRNKLDDASESLQNMIEGG